MSQLISNMFLLMIAALLIGWFFGWFLRRSATRKKYVRQIEGLEDEDKILASDLHINSVNYENNTRHLKQTQDRLSFAKQQTKEYSTKNVQLASDIEHFHLSQKTLETDLGGIDDKIKNSSDELDILNLEKNNILKSKDTISEYEQKIDVKTSELDTIAQRVSQLSSQREDLNTKVSNENHKISLKEEEISVENGKIKAIEDEFSSKRLKVIDEVEESRRKALNYQYAVNYVEEKIKAKEAISFDAVDKIISKNEEKGIFTNLIKKLFSKSAKYIKGGK